ncbi:MAG: FeoB-associated Cys-rich membrane protein [Methanomassiliicoccaceae archaeon]|nr:FeoB-associated Cys-rich membrane protein [Methanomassiliicoccaceae archaeon]
MLNAATLLVGLAVLAVVILASYSVYKTIRGGGCGSCSECPKGKGRQTCDRCPKNER